MDSHNLTCQIASFLLPPSCVDSTHRKYSEYIVSILLNSTMAFNFKNPLPAMSSGMNIGMDIQSGQVLTINSEVQGRNPLSSANSFRDLSMVSSG